MIFTPKAVINKASMDQFIDYWHGKVYRTRSFLTNTLLICFFEGERWSIQITDRRFLQLPFESRCYSSIEREECGRGNRSRRDDNVFTSSRCQCIQCIQTTLF